MNQPNKHLTTCPQRKVAISIIKQTNSLENNVLLAATLMGCIFWHAYRSMTTNVKRAFDPIYDVLISFTFMIFPKDDTIMHKLVLFECKIVVFHPTRFTSMEMLHSQNVIIIYPTHSMNLSLLRIHPSINIRFDGDIPQSKGNH